MTDKQKHYCAAICDYYGIESQLRQTIEELSELITAICKLKRPLKADDLGEKMREFAQLHDDLKSEIADVEIMLEQIKHYFVYDDIESYIEYKIKRQIVRMGVDTDVTNGGD